MHKLDQPQTTNTGKDRDAAAQIDDAYAKADAIWKGVIKDKATHNPDRYGAVFSGGFWLAIQLQNLTSSDKAERERAKTEVRRLMKLGKGE